MTASIFWEPVKPPKGQSLSVGAPSFFLATIEKAFGSRAPLLTEESIPTLRGMAATVSASESANPYEELIDAIQKHGVIRVWAEY